MFAIYNSSALNQSVRVRLGKGVSDSAGFSATSNNDA